MPRISPLNFAILPDTFGGVARPTTPLEMQLRRTSVICDEFKTRRPAFRRFRGRTLRSGVDAGGLPPTLHQRWGSAPTPHVPDISPRVVLFRREAGILFSSPLPEVGRESQCVRLVNSPIVSRRNVIFVAVFVENQSPLPWKPALS